MLRHPRLKHWTQQALDLMHASPDPDNEFAELIPVFELQYRPHRMRDKLRSPQSAADKSYPLMTHKQGAALPKAPKQKRQAMSLALQRLLDLACAQADSTDCEVLRYRVCISG